MIKRINQTLAAAALCVALAAPAFAEGEMPDSEHGRYSFSKVAEGFLRLDTQTGQVSVCSQRAVGWACQAAPEDRATYEREIERLQNENAALKQALLSHGLPLPDDLMPKTPVTSSNQITIPLPDNADVNRVMTYVGQVWQHFVDAVSKVQKQMLNKT